jgi:uncharacterized protein
MGQASHEPSMEDILASIKRIIAEDSEAVGARPTRLRREAISAVQSSPAIMRAADIPSFEPKAFESKPSDPEVDAEGLPEDEPEEAVAAPPHAWATDAPASEPAAPEHAIDEDEDEAAEEIEPVAAAPALSTEEPVQAPEDVLELTSPMSEASGEAPESRPEAAPETADASAAKPATSAPTGIEGLLSGQAATASRNAFAALSQLQVRNEDGKSNTLEGLVADLLRPMLREWLDRELPPLVERVVTAEVRRLSGSGGA